MKNLSTWASKNRTKSILLLIFLHILLGYFYFYTGVFFYLEGIKTPKILVPIASSLFILAWLFYPIKEAQQGIYKNTFFKRKFWQSIALISAAIFFIHAGNHLSRAAMANEVVTYHAESVVLDSKELHRNNKRQARSLKRSLRKKFRQRLRSKIKQLFQFRKRSEQGRKILYFVLIILGAIFLTFLLIGLSCTIACSGNEALSIIVLLGGFFLILWGLVAIYRKMFKQKLKEKAKAKPANG